MIQFVIFVFCLFLTYTFYLLLSRKTEAREAFGGTVRVIIDDHGWYDYIKLLSSFVTAIGYRGLVVIIDEAVNLYKITHTQARLANYEKLLTILNDCLQGKAQHLGILFGATPQMVEDLKNGQLYVQLTSEKAPDGNLRGWLAHAN